jgi:hypothetical protein
VRGYCIKKNNNSFNEIFSAITLIFAINDRKESDLNVNQVVCINYAENEKQYLTHCVTHTERKN